MGVHVPARLQRARHAHRVDCRWQQQRHAHRAGCGIRQRSAAWRRALGSLRTRRSGRRRTARRQAASRLTSSPRSTRPSQTASMSSTTRSRARRRTSADPAEIAFLFAADAGVFVAASAGNSGPTTGTVAHPSPWITTVAAGTHNRNGTGSVTLGNGVTYNGASVASAVGPRPFIDSEDALNPAYVHTPVAGVPDAADRGTTLFHRLDRPSRCGRKDRALRAWRQRPRRQESGGRDGWRTRDGARQPDA